MLHDTLPLRVISRERAEMCCAEVSFTKVEEEMFTRCAEDLGRKQLSTRGAHNSLHLRTATACYKAVCDYKKSFVHNLPDGCLSALVQVCPRSTVAVPTPAVSVVL